jgi:hypothetical protein
VLRSGMDFTVLQMSSGCRIRAGHNSELGD